MSDILLFFRSLGMARLAAMVVVTVAMVGFFAFVISRVTQPHMVPLYTELTFEDSAAIIEELEAQGVLYEARGDGAAIFVPKESVLRLRMSMAQSGLPSGGSIGYEIFDRSDSLGTTNFVQNVNRLRALEGELARTIRSLRHVSQARVHLVMPKRPLFQRDAEPPTASIVLKVRGELGSNQTRAIQHLVASAVPGLQPTRISIVDHTGKLLVSGTGEEEGAGLLGTLEERKLTYESQLRQSIEKIVFQIVGDDRARVQVTAELNRNRVTQTFDTYDPEGQVIRSSQSRSETANNTEKLNNGGVSVGTELPGADVEAGQDQSASASEITEEVINYEISRTTTTQISEAGEVNRLSVAVLIDGIYSQAEDGSLNYQPRPEEQLQQITTLVRSAIGFDADRGDQVEVVNMRFVDSADSAPAGLAEPGLFDFSKADYFYVAELIVMLLITLVLVIFVLRPLIRRVLAPEENSQQLAEGDSEQNPEAGSGNSGSVQTYSDPRIAAAEAMGAAHAEMMEKVTEMVESNPDDATKVVRNWIQEAA